MAFKLTHNFQGRSQTIEGFATADLFIERDDEDVPRYTMDSTFGVFESDSSAALVQFFEYMTDRARHFAQLEKMGRLGECSHCGSPVSQDTDVCVTCNGPNV